MRDSHAENIEDLRRELATLVVDWAGRMVKDDPASPLGQALTAAVRDAARGAVTEQYRTLAGRDAEVLAEALDGVQARRRRVLGLPAGTAALVGAGVTALLVLAFLLGWLLGRGPAAQPVSAIAPAAAETFAPEAEADVEPAAVPPQPAAEVPPPSAARTPPAPHAAAPPVRPAPRPRPVAPVQPPAPPASLSPNAGAAPVSGATSAVPAAAQ